MVGPEGEGKMRIERKKSMNKVINGHVWKAFPIAASRYENVFQGTKPRNRRAMGQGRIEGEKGRQSKYDAY